MSTSTPRIIRSLSTALIAASALLNISAVSAAAPTPSKQSPPVLSQQEIWMRAKFPWKFHPAAEQISAPSASALTQQEIWKRAKSAR